MNKRNDRQQERARRKQSRDSSYDPWAGFQIGDTNAVQVIGNPSTPFSEPTMREATLDDCVDECPLCQQLREQILSGNPPQVMAFD